MQHDDGHRRDLRFSTEKSLQSWHPPLTARFKHNRRGKARAERDSRPCSQPVVTALLRKTVVHGDSASPKKLSTCQWNPWQLGNPGSRAGSARSVATQHPENTAIREGGGQPPSSLNLALLLQKRMPRPNTRKLLFLQQTVVHLPLHTSRYSDHIHSLVIKRSNPAAHKTSLRQNSKTIKLLELLFKLNSLGPNNQPCASEAALEHRLGRPVPRSTPRGQGAAGWTHGSVSCSSALPTTYGAVNARLERENLSAIAYRLPAADRWTVRGWRDPAATLVLPHLLSFPI